MGKGFGIFIHARAILLPVSRVGQLSAFLAFPAVAIGVSGHVWGGIIIVALEFGFWALTRYLMGGRRQPQ